MDEIARGAGLGIGTLYRHFPSKNDIVTALLTEHLQRLLELANTQRASAGERFAAVVTEVVRLQSCDRSISDLGCCVDPELVRATGPLLGSFREALARLMADAVAAGELRADVTVDDVLRIAFNTGLSADADAWQPYARILLSGLRTRPDRPRNARKRG